MTFDQIQLLQVRQLFPNPLTLLLPDLRIVGLLETAKSWCETARTATQIMEKFIVVPGQNQPGSRPAAEMFGEQREAS